MKKFAVIGFVALVVIGCVLAAGCTSTSTTPATTTSTTTTTSTDAVVGIWTLPSGTTVVFGEDFNGIMATDDNIFNFTWKKTTDGKYQVNREDGAQVIWTLDKVKGTMTNPKGDILTKQASDTSGSVSADIPINHLFITLWGNEGKGGYIIYRNGEKVYKPVRYDNTCLGYFTEPDGGEMIYDANGELVIPEEEALSLFNEIKSNGFVDLYTHWKYWKSGLEEEEE